MPIAELQSEWVADLLEGKAALLDAEAMGRDRARAAGHAQAYVASTRHTIQVDFHPYMRLLRRERADRGRDPGAAPAQPRARRRLTHRRSNQGGANVPETTTSQQAPDEVAANGQPTAAIEVEPGHRRGSGERACRLGRRRGSCRRARAAQPAWEALGFEGWARILKRAQKWTLDNSERIARTIVSETGKAYEDALLAEVGYAAGRVRFRPSSRSSCTRSPLLGTLGAGAQARDPLRAGRRRRGDRPWNYPLNNSFGDCIPALAAGNACAQAGQPHPAHVAADGRGPARAAFPRTC